MTGNLFFKRTPPPPIHVPFFDASRQRHLPFNACRLRRQEESDVSPVTWLSRCLSFPPPTWLDECDPKVFSFFENNVRSSLFLVQTPPLP